MATSTEKIEIKIDGKAYATYNFLNIVLVQELLKPNELSFTMQKKNLLDSEDDSSFSIPKELLGAKVSCLIETARYDQTAALKNETLEFKGIIFKVNAYRSEMNSELLIDVQAGSPDYLLMDNPHCYSYENKSLNDIVSSTVDPYSIPAVINPQMKSTIPYTVQYNESNYHFLVRLAQRYGEWMYYDGAQWIFGKVKKAGSVELYPRVDLLNYRYMVDLRHATLKHGHHDYLKYENPVKSDKDVSGGLLQSLSGFNELTDPAKKKSQSLFTKTTFQHLQCSNPEESDADELEISLKAQLSGSKAQQAICTGTTVRADLRLGSCVTIKDYIDKDKNKLGYYDHDELLVCRIVHRADAEGNYRNEFTAIPSKSDYPPYYDNDVYPVVEAQRAKVIDNKDPEKLGRIRVQFLWQELQDASMITPWIRIAQPHGGDNKGFYFIPEIGEEVMTGFENGNAEKPYAIGTLYHGQQHPGSNWPSDSNDIKAIRTRNGHTIEIHDVGEGGFIRIYDNEKENYILTFSTDEKLIKLESTGNIELYAQNDIIMEAKNNINMKAGVDMNREAGENINETAGTNITTDAGKNISTSAGENISISAGKDMDTSVGENDSLSVGKNQTVDIGANKDETISEKFQLTAQSIRAEAEDKMQIYSNTHEQKSDSSMKLDGGNGLDLYASSIKIN